MTTPTSYGNYEVLNRITMGGMGEIYLARQRGIHGFERLAIVKTLLESLRDNEEQVAMFLGEARIAALLNHPGIVQIYEVGEQNGTYFIAMEFVEGDTMSALVSAAVKQQKHSPWPFVALISQAARALHNAHQQKDQQGLPLQLVHRDISPQNIMVRRDGVTKVVDFGIAKVAQGGGMRTATGVLKGKLAYMPPEQLAGAALDARADLYSLGVVLWELTLGRRMFGNMTEVDVFRNVMQSAYQKPSELVTTYPPALEAVVMKALKPNLEERFQTGNQFADALDAVLAQVPEAEKPNLADYVESLIGERVQERVKTGRATRSDLEIAKPLQEASTQMTKSDSAMQAMGAHSLRTPTRSGAPSDNVATMAGTAKQHTGSVNAAAVRGRGPPAWLLAGGGLILTLAAAVGGAMLATRPAAVAPVPVVPVEKTPDPVVPPAEPVEKVPERDVVAPPLPITIEKDKEKDKRPAPRPSPRPEPKPRDPAPVSAPAPVAGDGLLTLQSNPWADVSVDGQMVGTTPLFKLKLSAGKHTLVLKNSAQNLEKTVSITIAPGVELRTKVELR